MESYRRAKLLTEVLERFAGFHWILSVAPNGGFAKSKDMHPRTGPVRGPFVYKPVNQVTEDGRRFSVQSTEQAWFRAAKFDAEGNLLITMQNGRGTTATLVVDAEYLRPEDDNDLADEGVEGLIADHLRYLTAETVIGFTISQLDQAPLSELEARQLRNTRGD
jgi:hypothetical protein